MERTPGTTLAEKPGISRAKLAMPVRPTGPLVTNAMRCKILNDISRKHFRYSLFVQGKIAIEPQLYFLGLVGL